MFVLKICQKNSSVNLRFEIFVMAFRVRKLFGTFEKRPPRSLFTLKCPGRPGYKIRLMTDFLNFNDSDFFDSYFYLKTIIKVAVNIFN